VGLSIEYLIPVFVFFFILKCSFVSSLCLFIFDMTFCFFFECVFVSSLFLVAHGSIFTMAF
jgi:hypothetical protein